MLRHIGLAAVVVALVTLTADSVHARGGGRSGRPSYRNYNFGNSGYYNPNTGTNVSSHYRGTSGTSKSSARANPTSSEQTVQATTTPPTTKTLTLGGTGTSTATAQPTTTATKANAGVGTLRSQAQTPATNTITTNPLAVSPLLGVPLSTDPNTTAQRTYRGLLHNAKELIKAGMYAPAAADLQRIITGAPGTKIAAEAQRLLARLPV